MSIVIGLVATLMGLFSFGAAIIRAVRLERRESHENEMGAIGWFILAAICFKIQ